MPPFYIGSTSANKINSGYRGSVCSKKWKLIWKQELKDHPNLFHTEIVSLHETRKEAVDEEEKYQREETAVNNTLYLNECYAKGDFDTAGKTYEEIYGEEYGKFYFRIPDGESGADVYDRQKAFLNTLYLIRIIVKIQE